MWHIIPDSFRTHWKDWEVRFLVLFSLLLQIILYPSGTRRKATPSGFIHVLVWITYLTAESVPILTLGVISNWLSKLKDQGATGDVDRKYELFALWAPIVLVHLGGPDSITAYSIEDNELWLRHCARVTVQIGWTCYIYFLALSSSPLSYIAIGIIVIGILKNFERTMSLFYASKDEFRESFVAPPRSGLLYHRLTQSFSLKKGEGYTVSMKAVAETQASDALSFTRNRHLQKAQDRNAFLAYKLLETFQVLFAGLTLNLNALENTKSLFNAMTSENAFKIIDIELNLMFELLYTKASIICRIWGKISKITTLVLSLGVLVAFCTVDKRVYALKLDLAITFIVILCLSLSDLYSMIKVLSSDRMYALAIERRTSLGYPMISYIQSCQELHWFGFTTGDYRWSRRLTQFNILRLALNKTPTMFSFHRKIKKAYEKAVQYLSVEYEPLRDNLRIWIHTYLKDQVKELQVKELQEAPHDDGKRKPWLPAYGAAKRLEERSLHDLAWSTDPEKDFSQSLVIWHIATELLYFRDRKSIIENGDIWSKCEISRTLSRYLIYLLVQKPAMLPIGIGDNYYMHTLLEAQKFFEDQSSRILSSDSKNFGVNIGLKKKCQHKKEETFRCKLKPDIDPKPEEQSKDLPQSGEHISKVELDLCRLCHALLEVPNEQGITPKLVEDGENKSVLFHASLLVSQLKASCTLPKKRWEVIQIVWTEALLYSAYHSSGDVHSKQLSYGGELLTHVWLLMAHFGISKQVKTSTVLALKSLVQS